MPLKQFSSALVLAALLAGCSSNGDGPSTDGASVATGSASAPAATPAADG
ncbi:I78 family peptidase inhibitor, partial [Pseudomonas aeruginosa]